MGAGLAKLVQVLDQIVRWLGLEADVKLQSPQSSSLIPQETAIELSRPLK